MAKLFDGGSGDGKVTARAVGLRWAGDDAFAAEVAGAAEDLDVALVEVDGGPFEGEDFALAHACFEGDEEEGFEAGTFGGGEKAADFDRREAAHFVALTAGRGSGERRVDLE